MNAASLFAELKRRRVFRVLVGYGIVSFAVLQVVEPIMHALHLPDVTLTYTVLALALGFPVVVVLAWAFDINEGKIERTTPTASRALKGIPLPVVLIGIGIIAAAPGVIWYFVLPGHLKPMAEVSTSAPSIAVLPFVNLSSDKEQEYFSDGIAEEILNALAQVEGLKVIGRTSSFSFKGKNEDLRSIGEKLNVASVLEGSVRKEGNRIRITAQLIEAAGGSHLWSQTYERELNSIFAVQDEISRAVVAALRVKLLPREVAALPESRTANPEAYTQYLLGRQLVSHMNAETLRAGQEAFEKSITLDPAFAPARAGLSLALVWRTNFVPRARMDELKRRALENIEQVLVQAPGLADGHAIRGLMRAFLDWDWAGGQADLERALALAPSDVVVLDRYAQLLAALGQLPRAIDVGRKGARLDPLSADVWRDLGWFYNASGELGAAREALTRALGIAPDHVYAARELAFTELLDGKPQAALAAIERSGADYIRNTVTALAQHDLGHEKESQQALAALDVETNAYQIAQVHAWRGDRDPAFEWLERSYLERDTGMRYLKRDPFLHKLRGDPRYTALLKKMNLPLD